MSNFGDIFDDFIRSQSRFFDLPDGAEKTVIFLSVERVTTNFKGKEISCLRYLFGVEDKQLMWDRTSRELAKQMSHFAKGDKLRIRREGERNQTKYFIQKVNQ